MDIDIKVTLEADVDPRIHDLDHVEYARVEQSIVAAVHNALSLCEANGFNHPLSDFISIAVLDVSLLPNAQNQALTR